MLSARSTSTHGSHTVEGIFGEPKPADAIFSAEPRIAMSDGTEARLQMPGTIYHKEASCNLYAPRVLYEQGGTQLSNSFGKVLCSTMAS